MNTFITHEFPPAPRDGIYEKKPKCVCIYRHVSLGGTFDHLHKGHFALLSAALCLTHSEGTLHIGVTTDVLHGNKEHSERLEPYDVREAAVRSFLEVTAVNTSHELPTLDIFPLNDAVGPTGTMESLECLVVSAETRDGVDMINKIRIKNKLDPFDAAVVPVVTDGGEKISSTQIRQTSGRNERIRVLMARKDAIEAEAADLRRQSDLYPAKLTDADGYPLASAPIPAVLDTRHKLAVLDSEHMELMSELEKYILDNSYSG